VSGIKSRKNLSICDGGRRLQSPQPGMRLGPTVGLLTLDCHIAPAPRPFHEKRERYIAAPRRVVYSRAQHPPSCWLNTVFHAECFATMTMVNRTRDQEGEKPAQPGWCNRDWSWALRHHFGIQRSHYAVFQMTRRRSRGQNCPKQFGQVRRVVAEHAKAPDFISGAFQPEHKQLTGLDRAKIHLAGPPKIHFVEIRLRCEKVEPSIVGVGDE
jgi:hypothetical protein